MVILGKNYILRVQTNIARNEKIVEHYQTETIVCTYNQNTYTLFYTLHRRDESKEQSVNITYLTIFASQGLPSAPLLFTIGRLSQNCVILAYRPLAIYEVQPICITSLSTNENVVLLPVRRGGAYDVS